MECIQNKNYAYIFNPWSDGKRVFLNESQKGLTFKAMQRVAKKNESIAARVKLFQYRVVEEFYDFKNDPDALHNLIDDPKYQKQIDKLHAELMDWMKRTGDPALTAFQNLQSPQVLKEFMAKQQTEANRRKKRRFRKAERKERK